MLGQYNNFDTRLDELNKIIYGAAILPTTPQSPTLSDNKASRLQERITSKEGRLGLNAGLSQPGFDAPVTSAISSNSIYSIDGDTYGVEGREDSTRTLGVDTYESSKPNYSEWIKNPNMVKKMDEQVVKLSAEMGRQVDYSDVFAAGDAQKAEAKAYTQDPLPSLLQETLLTNNDSRTFKTKDGKTHISNYGRDLGLLETMGGLYTKEDGTTGDGREEVMFSNRQQAVTDNARYNGGYSPVRNAKLDMLLSGGGEDTDSYLGNLVDAAQKGVGAFAAGTGDWIVDAGIRLGKEAAKGIEGKDEDYYNKKLQRKLKGTMFEDLVTKDGDFVGFDKFKTAKYYGYDPKRVEAYTKKAKKILFDDNASWQDKVLVALEAIVQAPEVLAGSSGEILAASNPLGVAALAGKAMNEVLAERAAIKGTTELEASDYGIGLAAGTVYALVNKFTGGMAGLKPTKELVLQAAQLMDRAAWNTVTKSFLVVGANAVTKGFEEGLEEIIQDGSQLVGAKLGTSKQDEITSEDAIQDLAIAGLMGAGAGSGTSIAKDAASAIINNGSVVSATDQLSAKLSALKAEQEDIAANTTTPIKQTTFTDTINNATSDEDAAAIFEAQKNELLQEVAEVSKARGGAVVSPREVLATKTQEWQDDFMNATRIHQTNLANKAIETGDSSRLGATPEAEEAMRVAFSRIALDNDTQADTFTDNLIANNLDESGEVIDKDIPRIVKSLKEIRAHIKTMGGMDITREQIVTSGMSADKKGFMSYFRDALGSSKGSIERKASSDKLIAFTSLQEEKHQKLIAGRTAAIEPIANKINTLVSTTGLSEEVVWKALVKASSTGKFNLAKTNSFDNELAQVMAATGKTVAQLSIAGGSHSIQYASKEYMRVNSEFVRDAGNFDVNSEGSLIDYAQDLPWNKAASEGLTSTWKEGSKTNVMIAATGREVQAMIKASQLINKNNIRSEVSGESQQGTQEAQTEAEPVSIPKLNIKASGAAEEVTGDTTKGAPAIVTIIAQKQVTGVELEPSEREFMIDEANQKSVTVAVKGITDSSVETLPAATKKSPKNSPTKKPKADILEGLDETDGAGLKGLGNTAKPIDRALEIRSVAQDPESKYNVGTREALLQYITSAPSLMKKLKEAGIDLKDC